MSENKSVHVKALKYHTFGVPQVEYNEGDVYEVHSDGTQTADQYAETLAWLGFAKVVEKPKAKADKAPESKVESKPEPPSLGDLRDRLAAVEAKATSRPEPKVESKPQQPQAKPHVEPMKYGDVYTGKK